MKWYFQNACIYKEFLLSSLSEKTRIFVWMINRMIIRLIQPKIFHPGINFAEFIVLLVSHLWLSHSIQCKLIAKHARKVIWSLLGKNCAMECGIYYKLWVVRNAFECHSIFISRAKLLRNNFHHGFWSKFIWQILLSIWNLFQYKWAEWNRRRIFCHTDKKKSRKSENETKHMYEIHPNGID